MTDAPAVPFFEPRFEVEVARPFWEGIAAHELRMSRCSVCHAWQWYPDEAGPCCDGASYEWVAVPHTGELHTFSRVHRQFLPGPAGALPFVVGFVHLDGIDGPRFVAPVADGPGVRVGARVRATFVEIEGHTRPLFEVQEDRP